MPPRTIVDWIGVGGFAAYVTACNPYSRMLTDAQNEARAARLRERLSAARFLDGAGVIPDESWREPSLLINGIGLADIDALAHDFDQNAAVIVRSDRPAQLRIYRTDWRNIVGEPDIDWATELHGE
jgi:hypothetical protein